MAERAKVAFFLYGTLRPDDPKGSFWRKAFLANKVAEEPGFIRSAVLYEEEYVTIRDPSSTPDSLVHGILVWFSAKAHTDKELELEEIYDDLPTKFEKTIVKAFPASDQQGAGVDAIVFHREVYTLTRRIDSGDWVHRERKPAAAAASASVSAVVSIVDAPPIPRQRAGSEASDTSVEAAHETPAAEINNANNIFATLPRSDHQLVWAAAGAADQNPTRRQTMEDRFVALPSLTPDFAYFAVYDGHGGEDTVIQVAAHLHEAVAKEVSRVIPMLSRKESREKLEKTPTHEGKHLQHANRAISTTEGVSARTVEEALVAAFAQMDGSLTKAEYKECGSTAVCVLVFNKTLYVAHCGDSRAVMCVHQGDGVYAAQALTLDHKPSQAAERKRIESAHGWVLKGRVMGVLDVSRAFGDTSLKKFVPSKPDVVAVPLVGGGHEPFLVLACDGVFDVMSNQDCVKIVLQLFKLHRAQTPDLPPAQLAEKVSQALVREAINLGSTDNCTAVVVFL